MDNSRRFCITGLSETLRKMIIESAVEVIKKSQKFGPEPARRYSVLVETLKEGHENLTFTEYQTVQLLLVEAPFKAADFKRLVEKNKNLGVFRELGD